MSGGIGSNDGVVNLKGRIEGGQLVALYDHAGNELGTPVTGKRDQNTGGVGVNVGSMTIPIDSYRRNRTVLFGHSRIHLYDYGGSATYASKYIADYSMAGWFLLLAGDKRVNVVADASVGGSKVHDHAVSVFGIKNHAPTDVVYLGLINSVLYPEITTSGMLEKLQIVLDELIKTGARVHLLSDYPPAAAQGGWNQDSAIKLLAGNRFLSEYAAAHENCTFTDLYSFFVDSSTSIGSCKDGLMHTDNLHTHPQGARAAAEYLVSNLLPKISSVEQRVLLSSPVDVYSIDAASTNIVANGLMQGSGGLGAVGGPVPTGWTAGVTGVGSAITSTSVVARPDGVGNDAVVVGTFAAGAEGSIRYDYNLPLAAIKNNYQYRFKADVRLQDCVGLTKIEIFMHVLLDGVEHYSYMIYPTGRTMPQTNCQLAIDQTLSLPAGTTITQAFLRFRVYGKNGGAKLSVGRVDAR